MNALSETALTILIVVTSQATLGDGTEPSGLWLEELATPYRVLNQAGARVDIVSMAGGEIPVDPRSLQPRGSNPADVEAFLDDPAGRAALAASRALADADATAYDAIFFPGGHGTMWDFPDNPRLAALIRGYLDNGKPVAAVCHGPAALVGVRDETGSSLVAGRRISAFTDSEERAVGLDGTMPFLLESRLREEGARIESGPDFEPFAIRDGLLITGQNPASSAKVAQLLLEALAESKTRSDTPNPP